MASKTKSFSARFERINRRDDLYNWPTLGVHLHYGGTTPSRPARICGGWTDKRTLASWNRATPRDNPRTRRRLSRPLSVVVTRDADGDLCWTWS